MGHLDGTIIERAEVAGPGFINVVLRNGFLSAELRAVAMDKRVTFYEDCPVLKAPSEAERASRLALADLTARVLATGLDLPGIEAPDRM